MRYWALATRLQPKGNRLYGDGMSEATPHVESGVGAAVPRLRRVLSLSDLIFYGIVLVQPIAAIPLYGVAEELSRGQLLLTLEVSMLAMLVTAVSYGRMAALYPAAGSAYTYVSRGLNPYLGFLAGWAMFLGYVLQPLINTVWIATALHYRYLPKIPYVLLALLIAGTFTFLNLRGVHTTAVTNRVLLVFMCLVIGAFIILAIKYLYVTGGPSSLFSSKPFYDPKTFNLHSLWVATSFSALTYIGFDGVTTLAEDVQNPRRNVLLAIVLVVLFTGLFSGLQVYLGQLVWPDYHFANPETAFMDVCRRVGGIVLFEAMGAVLIVAAFGSALGGTLGAARILFGMGRDNILPRRCFAHLSAKKLNPTYNILIIGALALGGALFLNFENAAEVLNFGALISFMGVNLAAFWQFFVAGVPGRKRRVFQDAVLPLFGFTFCGWIWWGLDRTAMTLGGAWLALGLILVAVMTRGFRTRPIVIDFRES
jgi:putrescine importer